jgi:hypothetical protein
LFSLICDICLGWFCVVEAYNDLGCFTSPQLAWVFVCVVFVLFNNKKWKMANRMA